LEPVAECNNSRFAGRVVLEEARWKDCGKGSYKNLPTYDDEKFVDAWKYLFHAADVKAKLKPFDLYALMICRYIPRVLRTMSDKEELSRLSGDQKNVLALIIYRYNRLYVDANASWGGCSKNWSNTEEIAKLTKTLWKEPAIEQIRSLVRGFMYIHQTLLDENHGKDKAKKYTSKELDDRTWPKSKIGEWEAPDFVVTKEVVRSLKETVELLQEELEQAEKDRLAAEKASAKKAASTKKTKKAPNTGAFSTPATESEIPTPDALKGYLETVDPNQNDDLKTRPEFTALTEQYRILKEAVAAITGTSVSVELNERVNVYTREWESITLSIGADKEKGVNNDEEENKGTDAVDGTDLPNWNYTHAPSTTYFKPCELRCCLNGTPTTPRRNE
jgi:hypothetical protein